MRKNLIIIMIMTSVFILIFLLPAAGLNLEEIEEKDYLILNRLDHDPGAFTQGLEIYKGKLYESTGLYGRSSLRLIDLNNLQIIKKIKLKSKYFGEGITILNDKIYQLTWKEETVFIYDLNFKLLKTFSFKGEGWGLANDGKNIIMSDGSENIYFINPDDFKVKRKIQIKDSDNKAVSNINELEYHDNKIYANIWKENYIIIINPKTAEIINYLDLTKLLTEFDRRKINVLNGIAYYENNDSFLVGGKLWPQFFEIKILENQ